MLDHNHNNNGASCLAQSGNTDLAAQRWYIVQTHIHAEAKAVVHLRRQGFETYLPRYLKKRRHARRVDTVAAPLFPRYLFVSIDTATQRWHSIRSTIGISRLVTFGDDPAIVPPTVVEGLKRREDLKGFIKLEQRSHFASGDKIRVREGAFADALGLFESMSGEERVAILLDLLGRKVRVVLETHFIEAA